MLGYNLLAQWLRATATGPHLWRVYPEIPAAALAHVLVARVNYNARASAYPFMADLALALVFFSQMETGAMRTNDGAFEFYFDVHQIVTMDIQNFGAIDIEYLCF